MCVSTRRFIIRYHGQAIICVAVLLLLCPLSVHLSRAEEVKIYDVAIAEDEAEWPPYTYFERDGTNITDQVVGFSVDVIDAIFRDNDITYHVDMMPYARALESVRTGSKYQMILSASYNKERAEKYYASEPYYQTKGCYFYSKKNHPEGLNITCKEDLNAYKIGGIHGFNYLHYGQDNTKVDRGTYTFDALIEKMKFGRVDLFLENYETIQGYTLLGNDYLTDSDIGYGFFDDIEPISFYMWFTKNDQGLALKKIVDQGIKKLRETGAYSEIYKKYFP